MAYASNVHERIEVLAAGAALAACIMALGDASTVILVVAVILAQLPSLLAIVGFSFASTSIDLGLRLRWLRDLSALMIALGMGLTHLPSAFVVLGAACFMMLRGGALALWMGRGLREKNVKGALSRDAMTAICLIASAWVGMPGVVSDLLTAHALAFWCLAGFALVQLHWFMAVVLHHARKRET